MIVLALETSGDSGGAAVVQDQLVLAQAFVSAPKRHGAELMPCVDQALVEAKLQRGQIDVIAVNCGPGSYTGLRIGLAAATALGLALDKPVTGVPSFDAMALQFGQSAKVDASHDYELWPVLDARRDEVMTARFRVLGGKLERAGEDELLSPAKFGERCAMGAVVFGTGIVPYRDVFTRQPVKLMFEDFALTPGSVGLRAVAHVVHVGGPEKLPRDAVQPRYFRRILAKTLDERAEDVEA